MFESVLGRGVGAPGRPGVGAAISLGLHALMLSVAVVLSHPVQGPLPLPSIHFPQYLPKGPSGAAGPRAAAPTHPRPPAALKPAHSQEAPPSAKKPVDSAATDEAPSATPGGEPGAPRSEEVCAAAPCSPEGRTSGGAPIPLLGPEMVPPRLLSGPEPRYTAEAALEHAAGTVLARCTVTDRGDVEDCVVLKSVPLLDASVLRALAARRYEPALFQGRPLSVRMVIPVRFVAP